MSWQLWTFWLLVLVVLLVLAETARLDARAHEMTEERDKDLERKPCERCNDLR